VLPPPLLEDQTAKARLTHLNAHISLPQNVKPLIWIESVIERHSHSRVEYMIKAKSHFKRRSTANNVQIVIPVPADADSPSFKVRAHRPDDASTRKRPKSASLTFATAHP
jgi:transposase-like protein